MIPVRMLLLLTIFLSGFSSIQCVEKITATTGAYFSEVKGKHIYQQVAPILYHFRLSQDMDLTVIRTKLLELGKSPYLQSPNGETLSQMQNLLMSIEFIQKMNKDLVSDFGTKKSKRSKRGLMFMGDTLQWCCNVLTTRDGQQMLENQESLKKQYEQLQSAVLDSHSELVNVTRELQDFATHAADTLKNLHSSMDDITANLNTAITALELQANCSALIQAVNTHLFSALVLHSKLAFLHSQCKAHKIPAALINEDTFLKDLLKMKKAAKSNGLDLAIAEEDIKLYYHSKLVSCVAVEENIEIEIKIPLRSNKADYSLHKFVPITFKSHDNLLCSWEQDTSMIVYEAHRKSVHIVSGLSLDLCDMKEPICHVPVDRGNNNKVACASALFLETEYKGLLRACALKCESNHGNTIITQIEATKFAITNPGKDLVAVNMGNLTSHPLQMENSWPGISIIQVPCEYQVEQTSHIGRKEIIVPASIPCIQSSGQEIKVEHHLPIVWANVGDVEISSGFQQTFHFWNISTAYNREWAESVPYFTTVTPTKELAKRMEKIELKMPAMDGHDSWNLINILLIGWCSLLTFLFVVITYLLIRMQCKTAISAVVDDGTKLALNQFIRTASRENLDSDDET